MEPHRLPVLPSNYPVERSHSTASSSIYKRALQETTGNVQNTALDIIPSHNAKSAIRSIPRPSQLGSNGHLGGRPSAAARLEHRRSRRGGGDDDLRPFTSEEAIAYHNYRAKNGGNRDGVWPDHLEAVFQKALVDIECMGRRKLSQNGKPCGRNELISAYIKKHTGEIRTRKQVSSHIQVLKGHLKQVPGFMKLVTPKEDNPITNETLQRIAERLRPLNHYSHSPHSSQGTYYDNGPSANADLLGPHVSTSPSINVRPVKFEISIFHPDKARLVTKPFHTYTTLTNTPYLPPVPLEHLRNWRDNFPRLASLHHSGAVDCGITLLESSLNMTPPTSSLTGCRLGTGFEVLASSSLAGFDWNYVTNIYDAGQAVCNDTNTLTCDEGDASSDGGKIKLNPPFASEFWAQLFMDLSVERRYLEEHGDHRTAEEIARRHLRNISAVQELYATPSVPNNDGSRACSKLVAVFLWKFSKTRPGEADGRTTWRSLIPPPSRILTNSPAPPPVTAASLDSALWADVAPAQHDPFNHQVSLSNQLPLYDDSFVTHPTASFESLGGGSTTSPAETLAASPTPGAAASFYPSYNVHVSDMPHDSLQAFDEVDYSRLYQPRPNAGTTPLLEAFEHAGGAYGLEGQQDGNVQYASSQPQHEVTERHFHDEAGRGHQLEPSQQESQHQQQQQQHQHHYDHPSASILAAYSDSFGPGSFNSTTSSTHGPVSHNVPHDGFSNGFEINGLDMLADGGDDGSTQPQYNQATHAHTHQPAAFSHPHYVHEHVHRQPRAAPAPLPSHGLHMTAEDSQAQIVSSQAESGHVSLDFDDAAGWGEGLGEPGPQEELEHGSEGAHGVEES
ncbi:MAG: hypothetical protein M1817_000299 [Caeruleum heppii]|nr:MAG: hypothetical protein M1817_000299 [Caeruleum heppii]